MLKRFNPTLSPISFTNALFAQIYNNCTISFQLVSSNMIWGIFLALAHIVEWFFQAVQVQISLPIKIIFNNFRIICSIAKCLTFMQIFFLIYTNLFVLKKISNFNKDFFAMFLKITNLVLSFVLGCAQTSRDQRLSFFAYFGAAF